jgi:hypothetical protein
MENLDKTFEHLDLNSSCKSGKCMPLHLNALH